MEIYRPPSPRSVATSSSVSARACAYAPHAHHRRTFAGLPGQYLAFTYAYTIVNGRAPADTNLQRQFAITEQSTRQTLLTLERKGLLHRTPDRPAAP